MGERKATIGCEVCKRTIFDLEVVDLGEFPVFILRNCRDDGKVKQFEKWRMERAVRGYPELMNILVIDMKGDQSLTGLSESEMERAGWVKKNKVYKNRRLNRPKRDATPPPVAPETADLEGI